MSKSASPMELGELAASPDPDIESPQIEIDLGVLDPSDDQTKQDDLDRHEDNEDALVIQPPQLHLPPKDKHKHRHRNKKSVRQTDMSRETSSGGHKGDQARHPSSSHDKDRHRGSKRDNDGKVVSSRETSRDATSRDVTSRDFNHGASGTSDKDIDRRNRSQLERERLERLERERRRLEHERALRERAHKDKLRAEQLEQEGRSRGEPEGRSRGGGKEEVDTGATWASRDSDRRKEKGKKSRAGGDQQSASRSPPTTHGFTGKDKHTEKVKDKDRHRHGEKDGDKRAEKGTERQREKHRDTAYPVLVDKLREERSIPIDRVRQTDLQGDTRRDRQRDNRETSRDATTKESLSRSGSTAELQRAKHDPDDAESYSVAQKAVALKRDRDTGDVKQTERQTDRYPDRQREKGINDRVQEIKGMRQRNCESDLREREKEGYTREGGRKEREGERRGRDEREGRQWGSGVKGEDNREERGGGGQRNLSSLTHDRQDGTSSVTSTSSRTTKKIEPIRGLSDSPEASLSSSSSPAGNNSDGRGESSEGEEAGGGGRKGGLVSKNATPSEEEEEEEHSEEEEDAEQNSVNNSVSSSNSSPAGSDEDEQHSAGSSPHKHSPPPPLAHKSKYDDDSEEDEENNDDEDRRSASHGSSYDEQEENPHRLPRGGGAGSRIGRASSSDQYLYDSPVPSPVELAPQLPVYYPALQGCRNVEEFNCLNRIEEGTYGVVYRAIDRKTDEIVALKRLKMEKEKEGFPITSLREINTLLKAQHPNIVTVREIVVGSNMDKIYIVMDYVEHDLKALMESMKEPFTIGEVKTLLKQLLRGVAHLHDNWIIHRDLKTSNLLLSHKGILKIGDFGLAREYGSPLRQYTPIVVTLWYRSPELLLGAKEYSTPIDMWSVGCIFAEFLTKKPLFPGKSEIDELNRIFKELGTPNEKIWPGVGELPAMKKCTFTEYPYNQLRNKFGALLSDKGFDLLNRFLTYSPLRRATAEDALQHDFFKESPLPVDPSMFPTWPAKSEMSRSARSHGNSPKPPSGGKAAYASLFGDDDDIGAGHQPDNAAAVREGAMSLAVSSGFALKF